MMATHDDRPCQVLRAEHQVILRVIRVLNHLMVRLERTGEVAADGLRSCVEFLRLFADACHHAKEEDLLFPVLESRGIPKDGGPIGVMLYEHQLARGLTRRMHDALDTAARGDRPAQAEFRAAAGEYVALLTNHIFKEDNILFRMGDQVLSEDDQSELAARFCETGCRAFEGRHRDQLLRIADELEAAYPDSQAQ
jgi:hemerythrin-like domain-containing protein